MYLVAAHVGADFVDHQVMSSNLAEALFSQLKRRLTESSTDSVKLKTWRAPAKGAMS